MITKDNRYLNFAAYLIFPEIRFNQPIKTFDKSIQKRTFFNIPMFFNLTTKEDYFILEIAFVIGIGFYIKQKEVK